MKKLFMIFLVLAFVASMAACGSKGKGTEDNASADNRESLETEAAGTVETELEHASNDRKLREQSYASQNRVASDNAGEMEGTTDMKINVQIGNTSFTATLENTAAARECDAKHQRGKSEAFFEYANFNKRKL